MDIELNVNKCDVMAEVSQRTNYSGAKMDGDEKAYDRISTVDEDEAELNRFWDECRAEVAQAFIRLLKSEGMNGDHYKVVLNVSASFDNALLPGMELGLFGYFVQGIVSRWYMYTNKSDVEMNSAKGAAILEEVREKAFYKRLPTRPVYS